MKQLRGYLGPEHACEYLPGQKARSVFVTADAPLTPARYSQLVAQGFRRSGDIVYRPQCSQCAACIPVRIPVRCFEPSRNQRRTLRKNADLRVIVKEPEFVKEHYALYMRYLRSRHPDGPMVQSKPEDYLRFLTSRWCETEFYEFRLNENLAALAVVDHLDNGLSAVYTVFDPSLAARSLGTYAVLWQIQHAHTLGVSWVYLGFWIQHCRKMAYKNQFRPLEAYLEDAWLRFEKGENMV